jgi:hypothetical protein
MNASLPVDWLFLCKNCSRPEPLLLHLRFAQPARNITNARRPGTRVLLDFYFDRLRFRHGAFRQVNL